jgi:hypothetical protein
MGAAVTKIFSVGSITCLLAGTLAGMDVSPPPKRILKLKNAKDDPDTVLYRDPELAHGPLSTKWNSIPVLIVFYRIPVEEVQLFPAYISRTKYSILDGYVYTGAGRPGAWRRIFIGSILPEGNDPEIESVFFANADRDSKKELSVLVKWEQNHADFSGTLWGAFFYDDAFSGRDSLRLLTDAGKKLGMSCQCYRRDGEENETGLYQSAAEVKARLKTLGY